MISVYNKIQFSNLTSILTRIIFPERWYKKAKLNEYKHNNIVLDRRFDSVYWWCIMKLEYYFKYKKSIIGTEW